MSLNDNAQIENVSRRNFIKSAGIASGSLVLGIQLSPALAATGSDATTADFSPDVFVFPISLF